MVWVYISGNKVMRFYDQAITAHAPAPQATRTDATVHTVARELAEFWPSPRLVFAFCICDL